MACSELEQLRQDRDNLQRAIRAGVQSATVDGQTASYQSLRDMRSVLADVQRQIAILTGDTDKRPRASSFDLSRGVL